MKKGEKPREDRAAIREYIAEHWAIETDAEIAARFGVDRRYVERVRQRLGKRKSLKILSLMRENRGKSVKLGRYAHERMSEREKYERKMNRRMVRQMRGKSTVEQKAMRGESLTDEETDALMRAKGYIIP